MRLQKYADSARKKCPEIPQKVHPHLWKHTQALHLYLHGMDLFPNFTLKPERNREAVFHRTAEEVQEQGKFVSCERIGVETFKLWRFIGDWYEVRVKKFTAQ